MNDIKKSNKTERILLIVMIVFIVMVVAIVLIIDNQNSRTNKTTVPKVEETKLSYPIFTVSRETGFYSSKDSVDTSTYLMKGMKVKPYNDARYLDCVTKDVEGISITLCHVTRIQNNQSGWVIKNALD